MTTEPTKKYILIADDNKLIARVLASKIATAGYEVAIAGNGDEALSMMKVRKPDLLLMDLIMPVKDGFSTLRELRSDPALQTLKVIVTSDLQQTEDVEKVRQLGVLSVFGKTNFQAIIDQLPQFLA